MACFLIILNWVLLINQNNIEYCNKYADVIIYIDNNEYDGQMTVDLYENLNNGTLLMKVKVDTLGKTLYISDISKTLYRDSREIRVYLRSGQNTYDCFSILKGEIWGDALTTTLISAPKCDDGDSNEVVLIH